MPRAGFYNDNEYRQYPFVAQQTYNAAHLPTELIVDCGFIMGIDSNFDASEHIVYLHSLTKTAEKLIFRFNTTAPGGIVKSIFFERNLPATDWEYQHAESISAATDITTANVFCATEPIWSGFMVSGRLDAAAATLTDNTTYVFDQERVVEPGRVQSLVGAYLRSISLGNYARTVIQPCDPEASLARNRQIAINSRCLTGNIKIQAGFNCQITQNTDLKELRIAAVKDANTTGLDAAEFCQNGSEIKLHAYETPPVGSQFLSGGPACDEVITSINGLPAPDVKIVGGAGIQVVADLTLANTLRIKRVENLLSPTC